MQAIVVKYLGPTNRKGSRYKAYCNCGSITLPINHALNAPENRDKTVKALISKLNWQDHKGRWYSGETQNNDAVYVFAYASETNLLL